MINSIKINYSYFKNTFFLFLICNYLCFAQVKLKTGAENISEYLNLIRNKNVGLVANNGSIINIAILAVSIGITIIIIAISTGKGLQEKIKTKTTAFNGHISITPFENNESQISVLPFKDDAKLNEIIKKNKGINIINSIAFDGVILKNKNDFEGGLFKGVNSDYSWYVIKDFLVDGKYPNINKKEISNEIILSEFLADRYQLK